MTRHWRAVLVSVLGFAALGSSLPAQSAAGNAPPASVARDTGSVGRHSVTEAAARLGFTRVKAAAPADAEVAASTWQTVKWVLVIVAIVVLGFLTLAVSAL